MNRIKKAVIPAAGLGTRFLPATKTVPKEMLTIVDTPIILHVVEEAVAAGIEDIILVQGRGKTAIEDFFDKSYELEDKLSKDGRQDMLGRIQRVSDLANIISIRQKQPLGLGHAVLCAESIIGKEAFAVLLGDEIMIARPGEGNTTSHLVRQSENLKSSVVAVMEVPEAEVHKYGIANLESHQQSPFKVKSFVEKPKKSDSCWALPGRYVFEAAIFAELRNAKPGHQGEIQLTDSMNSLLRSQPIFASTFSAERFDAGDRLGYLKANVEMGLRNPELSEDFRKYIQQLALRLQRENS